jgi:hypothetical protein
LGSANGNGPLCLSSCPRAAGAAAALTLLRRSLEDFLPKTKSMASMTLDLPLPLGPTTEEKLLWKGPISFTPP